VKSPLPPSSFFLLPFFLLPFFLLPFFLLLATANSAGYRYGASDQAFYAPAIMQRLDATLFPRDTALLNTQADLTFADETIAGIVRRTGLTLPFLLAALYVLTLGLLAAAAFWIGSFMFRERWTTAALLAGLSLRHAIAKSGTNTLEGYFHPRQLAFALGALAVCAFMRKRYFTVPWLIAGAAALHPTTTLWFVTWLYVAGFVAERHWRVPLAVAAALAAPVVWWTLAAGPLAGRLVIMDAEWLAAIADKDYLFPLRWPWYVWALNLGYAVLILAVWRLRASAGALRERETAVVVGCLSLLGVFGVALVLQSRAIALAVQLQPARIFWMLDFLATIYLMWLLAEGTHQRVPRRTRAVLLAAVLGVAAAGRGFYIMQVQFPDRALAQVDIRDDDWGRVMAWARSTPPDTGWLADPLHAALYGTSVRVAAARDVFVEALKDSALGMYDRRIAMRTATRYAEVRDFNTLTPARARELAAAYDLDFLVSETVLDLPVVYSSGGLRVYRIR
jgi:hypothetical protein